MKPRSMKRREVIALDGIVPDRVTYLAARPQWDGAWHTPDINRAKIHRHPQSAQARILAAGGAWKQYGARVVDARSVHGYVDKPSAAAKRHAAAAKHSAKVAEQIASQRPRTRVEKLVEGYVVEPTKAKS